MASQTLGIQQLLSAEKKANDKVVDAKKRKAMRLKTAKKEADAEIHAFKSEKEKSYKDYEGNIFGSRSDMELQIQKGTDLSIKELAEMYQKHRDTSIKSILEIVENITIELHENLKL